jgi:Bifunctional DNA primase/polymerase, N-terminal
MTTGRPFGDNAQDYASRGFSPLPILAGKKVPGYAGPSGFAVPMTNWTSHCDCAMTPGRIEYVARMDPGAGLGLAMGFNDVAAIDVDDADAFPVTREILGPLGGPVKVGRKGGTMFVRAAGIASRKFLKKHFTGPDGKVHRPTLVEILAHGAQTVIPPTVHPDTGQPYRWIRGDLTGMRPADLPPLTPDHVAQIEEALAPFMAPKNETASLDIQPRKDAADIGAVERRRYEGFAWRALESECANLAAMGKPGRNDAVFRIGCLLGRWVWNGILKASDLESAVKSACERNGLIKDNGINDIRNTLNDGLARAANDSLPVLAERARNIEGGCYARH